jgi:hypothetical protein
VLALDGQDQRGLTYTARRARLEHLSAGWRPPLEICPSTADRNEATAWSADYRRAGIEGLVIKSATGHSPTGRRDWIKVKNRQTREVIVGAVIGSIRRPESVIAAALIDGELAVVGLTVALTTAQALQLAKHLTPADDDHPWPDELGTGVFGQRARVAITKVRPELVAEVAADPALQGRRYRHALRYLRLRTDMDPTDVARTCLSNCSAEHAITPCDRSLRSARPRRRTRLTTQAGSRGRRRCPTHENDHFHTVAVGPPAPGITIPSRCSQMAPECARLVVDGSAADLMVGVKEGFVEERADVTTAQAVHDPLSVPLALDEAGEPQL